jgi:hypothetical protein
VAITPEDAIDWAWVIGLDTETNDIARNRSEIASNAKALREAVETLEDYNPDLGRIVLSGLQGKQPEAADGGHRGRLLYRLARDGKGKVAIVDILLSKRPPGMGGYDAILAKRNPKHEAKTLWGSEIASLYDEWLQQTAKLLRLRIAGKLPEGGGKTGETWKGKVLRPNQSMMQWDKEFSYVWNLIHGEKFGEAKSNVGDLVETLKISNPQAFKADKHDRFMGLLVVAMLDVAGDCEDGFVSLFDSLYSHLQQFGSLVASLPPHPFQGGNQ